MIKISSFFSLPVKRSGQPVPASFSFLISSENTSDLERYKLEYPDDTSATGSSSWCRLGDCQSPRLSGRAAPALIDVVLMSWLYLPGIVTTCQFSSCFPLCRGRSVQPVCWISYQELKSLLSMAIGIAFPPLVCGVTHHTVVMKSPPSVCRRGGSGALCLMKEYLQ